MAGSWGALPVILLSVFPCLDDVVELNDSPESETRKGIENVVFRDSDTIRIEKIPGIPPGAACLKFAERARFLWLDRRELLRNLQKSPEHIYY